MVQPVASEDLLIPKPEKLIVAVKAKVEEMIPWLVLSVLSYVQKELNDIMENPIDQKPPIFNSELTSIRKEFWYWLYETAIKSNIPKGLEEFLVARVIDIYRLAWEEIQKSGWNVEIVEKAHPLEGRTDNYAKLIISATIDTGNTQDILTKQ